MQTPRLWCRVRYTTSLAWRAHRPTIQVKLWREEPRCKPIISHHIILYYVALYSVMIYQSIIMSDQHLDTPPIVPQMAEWMRLFSDHIVSTRSPTSAVSAPGARTCPACRDCCRVNHKPPIFIPSSPKWRSGYASSPTTLGAGPAPKRRTDPPMTDRPLLKDITAYTPAQPQYSRQ